VHRLDALFHPLWASLTAGNDSSNIILLFYHIPAHVYSYSKSKTPCLVTFRVFFCGPELIHDMDNNAV